MDKICVIGAGNWGTTIAMIIAEAKSGREITLWCYEEVLDGRKLTEIINTDHENPKYLPGVPLPRNIVARTDKECVSDCDIAVFALPHQFLKSVCEGLSLKKGVVAISLTKGFIDDNCTLASDFISRRFGTECAVLMGANIASGLSRKELAESTLGSTEHCDVLRELFECEYLRIRTSSNIVGMELCGALKNVVAVAYGVVCGLGCGPNTRAAIIRVGLDEMRTFLELWGVSSNVLFESCGVPDLIVTCLSGRNRKCGEALAQEQSIGSIVQGPGTAQLLYRYLGQKGLVETFPLFTGVYRVCYEKKSPRSILSCI